MAYLGAYGGLYSKSAEGAAVKLLMNKCKPLPIVSLRLVKAECCYEKVEIV